MLLHIVATFAGEQPSWQKACRAQHVFSNWQIIWQRKDEIGSGGVGIRPKHVCQRYNFWFECNSAEKSLKLFFFFFYVLKLCSSGTVKTRHWWWLEWWTTAVSPPLSVSATRHNAAPVATAVSSAQMVGRGSPTMPTWLLKVKLMKKNLLYVCLSVRPSIHSWSVC